MDRVLDLVGSVAVALLGIVILVTAAQYPDPSVDYDPIGPMGLPIALAVALLALAVLQIVRTARAYLVTAERVGPMEGTADEDEYPASAPRAMGFIVGGVLYASLLSPIGYLLLTPLALTLGLGAMRYRGWPGRIVVAVLFTVVGFIVFDMVLSVSLPTGLLGDWLVDIGLVDFTS